jgi:hypothetical protein
MIDIKRKDGSVLRTIDADSLVGANLRGADLQGANLQGASLRLANLQGADLQGANLRDVNLRGANLREADLRDVNLQDADLRGANLREANLRYANLQGADLDQCKQYVAVIRGSRDSIVAIDDDIEVGCRRMTLAEWLERFEAVGREAGYTEQQIAEYGIYLRAIRDVLEARKHETTDR